MDDPALNGVLVAVGTVALLVSTVVCTASVICYHIWSRGAWVQSHMGRHLMTFMAAFAVNLLTVVARLLFPHWLDQTWFAIFRAAVFVSIPVVLTWRFWIIYRSVGPRQQVRRMLGMKGPPPPSRQEEDIE
jgi:hypothetical protein